MSEIRTAPRISYNENGEELVTFGPEHTWADVVRWIATNQGDLAAVKDIIEADDDA